MKRSKQQNMLAFFKRQNLGSEGTSGDERASDQAKTGQDSEVLKVQSGQTELAANEEKKETVEELTAAEGLGVRQGQTVGRKNFTGGDQRSYREEWKNTYPWVRFDKGRDKVFCSVCERAVKDLKVVLPGSQNELSSVKAFVTEGFSNWKKALERFRTHENGNAHKFSVTSCCAVAASVNVMKTLSSAKSKEMEMARKALLAIISSIRFLGVQGLAIRGHEEKLSNFRQLLKLRCDDNEDLKHWLSRDSYKWLSHDIVEELITVMADEIVRHVIDDVKKAEFYALILDETADVAQKEQVSLSLRVADDQFQISEKFIGFYEVSKTDSMSLFNVVQDVLLRFGLSLQQCRGQCYDGAASVSGRISGLQTKIREVEPRALFVHCSAHSLNLAVQDGLQCIPEIRNFLSLIREIIVFVRGSPKRLAWFETFQAPDDNSLKPFCPTRWCVRICSLQTVVKNYPALLQFLEEVSEQEKGDTGAKADGFLNSLQLFQTYFLLRLSISVFSKLENLNMRLQKVSLDFEKVDGMISIVKDSVNEQRKNGWEQLWTDIAEGAANLELSQPVVPRLRKKPARFKDPATAHAFTSPEAYHRQTFFMVLDQIHASLEQRFASKTLDTLKSVEKFMTTPHVGPDSVVSFYGGDFDAQRLMLHKEMILDVIKNQSGRGLPKCLSEVTQFLREAEGKAPQELFPEYVRLLKCVLTVPTSTCTAERSFSSLRRIKSYLRSTMTARRLNSVAILHIHRDEAEKLDLNAVANAFISRGALRRSTFGSL